MLYIKLKCGFADEEERKEAESFRRFLEREKTKSRSSAATNSDNDDGGDAMT